MSRRLVILRHAKAEPGAATDHERVLTGRGRKDSLAAGRWLAEAGIKPDRTICSTAARAKETWALAAMEFGDDIATHYERKVYSGEAEDLLRMVNETPDEIRTLVMVGHNPTLHTLVLALAGSGEERLLSEARDHFGTAAVAVLDVAGKWSKLGEGQATLAEFAVPRG